jgi:hypothetical protein
MTKISRLSVFLWNYIETKQPSEGQEVILIADHDEENLITWCAIYRKETFYVTSWDNQPPSKLGGKVICWIPLPESPFN